MPVKIEKITEPFVLGESPHWDDRHQALFFINFGNGINKYVPSTGAHTKTTVGHLSDAPEERLGFMVPVDSALDQFVVGHGRRFLIIKWDGEEGSNVTLVEDLGEVDTHEPNNNFNDGKADPKGRIFAGTMGPINPQQPSMKPRGSLFRLDADKKYKIEKVWDNIMLANGLAWDLAEKAMYYVDSLERKIRRYDYDLDTGNISNLSYVYHFSEKEGMPDGMTIDTDGNLWVAAFGGSCVYKIDPRTKKNLDKIEMPMTQVTSVTFGGPNLDILFVTTANFNLEDVTKDNNESSPLAGATFMVTGLGVKGLPNVRFKY